MIGCAGGVHTLDSTKNLNRGELAGLCADLEIRANQDCRWNMQERQSSVTNQQTWEINCRARRDSARQSFDNACHPARFTEDGQDSASN
jgi:hypothetical protein